MIYMLVVMFIFVGMLVIDVLRAVKIFRLKRMKDNDIQALVILYTGAILCVILVISLLIASDNNEIVSYVIVAAVVLIWNLLTTAIHHILHMIRTNDGN